MVETTEPEFCKVHPEAWVPCPHCPPRDPWYPGGERDATLWVEEFFKAHPNGCTDADTMLGWFANAIETGVVVAQRLDASLRSTSRDSEVGGETRFAPWFSIECQQMCGAPFAGATEDQARGHAEATGHETALIRHESTHYRRTE